MANNLQLFRSSIKEYLPSQQIDSLDQFQSLINHLCDIKLLHPEEVKRLLTRVVSNQQIKFPINFPQLQLIIMTHFGDSKCQQMLQNLKSIKEKLRQTKGVLAIWKDKGLTKKERYELESIFERGNIKMRQFYSQLQQQKHALENISEQQLQMIDSLNEWVKVQKVQQQFKGYEQYQKHHQKLIDQTFNRMRVREVHFKQRKNTSKVVKIQMMMGLDSKNDQPVEVTLIPKRSLQFNVLNQQLLTFNAKKELMLSPHFNRFLGYNTHADTHCFFYFSQYIQGINLQTFITNSKIEIDEETPLFKYWAYLLYKSLYDIYLMSSYIPRLPIALGDFQIANRGLKLILKNIQFAESREQAEPEFYEAQLLNNLGKLILGLIKIDSLNWNSQTKIGKIQNKSVLNCLLNSSLGHKNYRQGRVKGYINFFNLQTHPLFECQHFIMGETIIQSFDYINNAK